MSSILPNLARRKRPIHHQPENIVLFGSHVFIRRWHIDANLRVIGMEVRHHA